MLLGIIHTFLIESCRTFRIGHGQFFYRIVAIFIILLDMDFAGLISVVLTKSQTVIIFGIIGKPAELFAKPAIAYTTAG